MEGTGRPWRSSTWEGKLIGKGLGMLNNKGGGGGWEREERKIEGVHRAVVT